MKPFSGIEMQNIIVNLQIWANENFENSWRGTILTSVAEILEAFLIGLEE